VYTGVIADHRSVVQATDETDLVTQDMLIGQLRQLELFQWFVRAHLETASGTLSTANTATEREAASQAAEQAGHQQ
jgi:starvation-inducible DNA-binding protein